MVASSVYFPQNKLLIGSLNANARLHNLQRFSLLMAVHIINRHLQSFANATSHKHAAVFIYLSSRRSDTECLMCIKQLVS